MSRVERAVAVETGECAGVVAKSIGSDKARLFPSHSQSFDTSADTHLRLDAKIEVPNKTRVRLNSRGTESELKGLALILRTMRYVYAPTQPFKTVRRVSTERRRVGTVDVMDAIAMRKVTRRASKGEGNTAYSDIPIRAWIACKNIIRFNAMKMCAVRARQTQYCDSLSGSE